MNRLLVTICALAWLSVCAWGVGIYVASNMSGQEVHDAMPFDVWDKALHFIAFAIGAFLLAAALRLVTPWRWRSVVPAAALAISLYGFVDEWHQLHTKGRAGGDPQDWAADTLGGIAGAASCAWAGHLLARRRGAGFRQRVQERQASVIR